MPKWYIAKDVTREKTFNSFEEAMKWFLLAENASDSEIMLEHANGVWKVYW